ncbi:MAG: HEPN domain-containing protein [Patescibacteria group bacterium]
MSKDLIQKWLKFAKSDLEAAEYLFHKPNANQWTYLLVVWHCHQAIEKILKAIIIKQNKDLLRIHDLLRLFDIIADKKLFSKFQKDFLMALNQYYITPRYPDLPLKKSQPIINRQKAKDILEKSRNLFLCLEKKVN